MLVSELGGEKLAYWVARAQGWKQITDTYDANHGVLQWVSPSGATVDVAFARGMGYRPDVKWSQCGELVEKYGIQLALVEIFWWANPIGTEISMIADTPQIAICRAVVAAVYGESVSDEEEQ